MWTQLIQFEFWVLSGASCHCGNRLIILPKFLHLCTCFRSFKFFFLGSNCNLLNTRNLSNVTRFDHSTAYQFLGILVAD